jgi:hypothetical protein
MASSIEAVLVERAKGRGGAQHRHALQVYREILVCVAIRRFARRSNPGELPAVEWVPLRRAGVWSRDVRELVRGKRIAYALRETAHPSTCLYVGSSAGDPVRRPEGAWKVIKRHFQTWTPTKSGQYGLGFEDDYGWWSSATTHDLDVAIALVRTLERAREVEEGWTVDLDPIHVSPVVRDRWRARASEAANVPF